MKKFRTKNLYKGELVRYKYTYNYLSNFDIEKEIFCYDFYPRKYVLVKKRILKYKNILSISNLLYNIIKCKKMVYINYLFCYNTKRVMNLLSCS